MGYLEESQRRDILRQADEMSRMGLDYPNPAELKQAAEEELSAYEEGRKDFEQLQESGEIPKGAHYTGTGEGGAVKYIPAEELAKVEARGREFVSQSQTQTKALGELKNFRFEDGYDLSGAIRAGKIDAVRKAGFAPVDIVEAQGRAADVPKVVVGSRMPPVQATNLERKLKSETSSYQKALIADVVYGERSAGDKSTPTRSPELARKLPKLAFNKLPDVQKEQVLDAYASQREAGPIARDFAIGMTPVVGTIVFWKTMSPAMRTVSIVSDVLTVVPIGKVGALAKVALKGRAAVKVEQVISAGIKESRATVKAVDKSLVKPFDKLVKAQNEYAKVALKNKELAKDLTDFKVRQIIKPVDTIAETERKLVATQKQINPARMRLEQAAKDFAEAEVRAANKATKGKSFGMAKAGFNDARLDDLGRDMVARVDDAVDIATTPKATVRNVTRQINATEKQLARVVQARDAAPNMARANELNREVQRLVIKQNNLEGQLATLKAGDAKKLSTQLNLAVDKLSESKANLRAIEEAQLRSPNKHYEDAISAARQEVRANADKVDGLRARYWEAQRHLTVEWAEPIKRSGGTGTMTRPKTGSLTGGGVSAKVGGVSVEDIGRMTAAQIARYAATQGYNEQIPDAAGKTIAESMKAFQVGRTPFSDSQIREITDAGIEAYNEAKSDGATDYEAQQAAKEGIAQKTKSMPDPGQAPRTAPAPQPGTQTPTPTPPPPTKEQVKRKIYVKPLLPRASDKEKREFIKRSKGAVCFKMGALHGEPVWITYIWPFQGEQSRIVVVGRKPQGAKSASGPGSAYKTAVKLYGKDIPKKTWRDDLGFMDLTVSPTSGNNVRLTFSPDRKGVTRGDFAPITRHRGVFPLRRR